MPYFLQYRPCRDELLRRLAEPEGAYIQLLTGPRQVGKTTLLLEIAETLGAEATYAAFDGPEAALPGYWEAQWTAVESRTVAGATAVLLLDEIQHVRDWSARVKGEWDRLRRLGLPIRVVASGSSALAVGAGAKESLAGRFERLVLSHWSAAELGATFGLGDRDAAEAVVNCGGYPGAMRLRGDERRWRAYVRDAIVEPAVGRDILALTSVRHPALLRQVFHVAASAPAQILSLQKLRGMLSDRGALETVAHYLALLEDAYLVAPLKKHAATPLRRRAAPPKLIVLDNALLAALDPRGRPDPAADPARFGAWVENACLAHAWNAGQQVRYWRQEPLEVDGVIEGSWGSWAIEVKTGAFASHELRGIAEFCRLFPGFRPLVLCDPESLPAAWRAGFTAQDWRDFLLRGPAPTERR